jgi:hypothetical protein
MAEPSAAAPARVADSGPDALLATKLHVPRPRPGFVPRPRLVEAFGEGLARRLILVCAPAGSGKTTLLADWAPSGNRPVAWLSLDAADNDPVRLWRYVERVGPLLGPPAPPSLGAGDGADQRAGRRGILTGWLSLQGSTAPALNPNRPKTREPDVPSTRERTSPRAVLTTATILTGVHGQAVRSCMICG